MRWSYLAYSFVNFRDGWVIPIIAYAVYVLTVVNTNRLPILEANHVVFPSERQ